MLNNAEIDSWNNIFVFCARPSIRFVGQLFRRVWLITVGRGSWVESTWTSYPHLRLSIPTTISQIPWTPSRFSARSHGPSRKRRLNSFAVNAIQWRHHANFTLTDMRFRNRIFQTEVNSTRRNRFFTYLPIPGYLPVWNAVCFISYSNLDESSCVHTFTDGILTSTRIMADTKCVRISGEMLKSPEINQVRKIGSQRVNFFFLKFATSHSLWAYLREYTLSALDSLRYFPH